MRRTAAEFYRCPYTREPLTLESDPRAVGRVQSGQLVSASGRRYRIEDGLPYLVDFADERLSDEERQENAYYQESFATYDTVLDWVFQSFAEDEHAVREQMIDLLELRPGMRVLETGAGTCRDTMHIARRLGPGGELYVQDLSAHMLALGRQRMESAAATGEQPRTEYFVGNAAWLPFPDRSFDAAFHFGGINLFSDRRQAIAEMTRVVRFGGRVVFGDEGVAPWLRDSLHGQILMNSNRLYRHTAPIELLPECARDASLRWFLGNAYYLIGFRVGDGPPPLDLDLPILGRRGGTHRTRFHGVLEGVTVETKALAQQAALASGMTMHDWLERVVRSAAQPAACHETTTGGRRC